MARYPIFLDLTDRRVLIIGQGSMLIRKASSLLDTAARIVIISYKPDQSLITFCQQHNIELVRSKYSSSFLTEAFIVIAATEKLELNQQIFKDCQKLAILCNIVDQPQFCNFFVPAIVKRGHLQIAISTEGSCPAYAGHLRRKFEDMFTEHHARFLEELEKIRAKLTDIFPACDQRKIILGKLADEESFDYFIKKGSQAWRQRAENLITQTANNQ